MTALTSLASFIFFIVSLLVWDPDLSFVDERYKAEWSVVVLLAELYTHAMLTMGDDEFFSSGSPASQSMSVSVPPNPLNLDDLKVFSRKLLNIAFALYSREDGREVIGAVGSRSSIRKVLGKCLRGIHARE